MNWMNPEGTTFYVLMIGNEVMTDEYFQPYVFWDENKAEDFIYLQTTIPDIKIVSASLVLKNKEK